MVSVCLPTYNGAAYLHDCLDSVLSQTRADLEVLIVDDGSTDATVEIATEAAARDSRVRIVINGKRYGLAANWNRCIELARGEWIKFLFQDDLLAPNCLEAMVQAAEKARVLFVCCRREFIFEGNVSDEQREFYFGSSRAIGLFFAQSNPMPGSRFAISAVERFRDNLVGEPTATLLHKSIFQKYGSFETDLIMCCDYEFWNRVASNLGVAYVPEPLATFRVHGRSTSAENAALRGFRMTQLDWFIILHNALERPAYAALRRVVRAHHGSGFLRRLCEEQAARALAILESAERQDPDAARSCRREWNNVAELYPLLEKMAAAGRARERLGKAFSPAAWRALLDRMRRAGATT